MKKWCLLSLLMLLCISNVATPVTAKPRKNANEGADIRLIVRASEEAQMQTELRIASPEWERKLRSTKPVPADPAAKVASNIRLSIREGRTQTWYEVETAKLDLYDMEHKQVIRLPEAAKQTLAIYIQTAYRAHYGEMLPWTEVKQIIGMKSVSQVTDLETGLSFQVQRRAGSHHADMQPLTKADTAIMKEIYHGKWSWKRRAVLVEKDGHVIAGSMHGMPHGGDGIPDNDFSGHFCIHFLGSTTHGSGNIDPDHQLMIHKAAGRLDEVYAKASPYEVIDSFFIALNQQDPELLRRTFSDLTNPQLQFYLSGLNRLKTVKPNRPRVREVGSELTAEVPVEVVLTFEDQRPEKQVFTFTLKRSGEGSPWKIDTLTPISRSKR
ncbi:hypothetical protein [Paenibacillus cremeus]|uniref:Uncharacterized protein n=1 Tax=Paenibacillus cremeus TaxID=2163881 RepID=A0A559K411_9BACL|nr:hypothetical protein [Paenibacillus cremeus]TVY06878.1 hypothetical protein FPZ49_27170 [Paenibacillus cremeus]